MAINPPSDIVLGAILAADPSKYRAAADRLGGTAWDATSVAAAPAARSSSSASQPAGDEFQAPSAAVQTSSVTSPPGPAPGRAAKSPDAFAQLEAFVLQSFIQTMLPKNSQGFFGKGTAGEVWKSMLAEKLGAQIASSNQIGLAKRLAAGRSDAMTPPSAPAALEGAMPVSSSLVSILPYIRSAAPQDDTVAGESAAPAERS